jgi:2-dehydropantoate 2-reductase
LKIGIMGSGGVGGYFGARLAAAGNPVAFVARGRHLAAIRQSGLQVRSPLGDVRISPATASENPAELGVMDVVLFATKLYDTESAGVLCRPLVGEATVVISLQNGVDGEAQLAGILGEQHVAGGIARISAAITEPGQIQHYSEFASIEFGETDGSESQRLRDFLAVAEAAGIDAKLSTNITVNLWEKFVLLASMAAVTALTRLPIGPVLDDPRSRALLHDAVVEVAAVAAANDVELADGTTEKVLHYFEKMPPAMKASMLVDLERGNRLELDWLSGSVCRMGEELDIDTPVHRVALAALSPFAGGAPTLPDG